MISQKTLDLAIEQSIISNSQLESLKLIEKDFSKKDNGSNQDQEKIRFISGFGDIFVFIGIVLFLGASGYFLYDALPEYLTWFILSALSWGLAELFSRKQKMAFPSIVLLLCFTAFTFLSSITFLSGINDTTLNSRSILNYSTIGITNNWNTSFAILITCLLTYLHYLRFRVPIAVASGVATLAATVYTFLLALMPNLIQSLGTWPFLIIGLLVFALAMRFDTSDLTRETRKTDIAFWLHLLAAPLIVHSVIWILFGSLYAINLATAVGILCIFVILAIIAVLIDRRAILVSGLIYAGTAFASLLKETALSNAIIPASLLTLGIFILVLSIGWNPLRAFILRGLPEFLSLKLPHQNY